ncbi:alpha-galactosidase, partial [Alkalibacterium iburiense]
MDIKFNKDNNIFHLKNEMISYVFSIEENKYLSHHYWGKALKEVNNSNDYPRIDRSFAPNPEETIDRNFSLAVIPQEFPGKDIGDFREPAYTYADSKGMESNRLEFKGFTIEKGKRKIDKLPHIYLNNESEAMTLSINLYDSINNVDVILYYSIFKDLPVITRHVKVFNNGNKPIVLKRVLSMSVDFIDNDFELIQLPGAWSRERELVRNPIYRGIHKIDSKHGTTSHTYQPFIGLVREDTKEDSGEVYGMQLVYSGEFIANVEVDPYDQTRVQMGINPYHFEWELKEDDSFETPEVVMVYSDKGLNNMSQTFHNLYQNNLIRGKHKYENRPILINNWEATYFDFNEEKLLEIAQESKELGIELFVLDDGWFGNRNDDKSSLGDWIVDKKKLPNGLKQFRNAINDMGMKFGLWFEPEMVSEASDLYRNHPDWCIHVENRPRSRGRSQLILDFSRKEVRNYILKQMKAILDDVPLDYIKWDYNRNMSEIGSAALSSKPGEVSHKYILGLYEVMEELVTSYPNILFESCSGGGGRYDPGMLYYMPQTWTSDNTDAVSRLKIQYGTSLTMPISSMGAH